MKIRQQVEDLPASDPSVKAKLFKMLDRTNVVLLSGETGSGKTTQVPKMLWEYLGWSDTVICTQPLTLTAAGVAGRVAKELDVELGRHVGFRFKGSEKAEGGSIIGFPILVYMTEGTFLSSLARNPASISNYGAIIIDEAHNRSINTDTLLFYIREVLKLGGVRTKFVIMSATLDKEKFMDYFADHAIEHIHIPGKTFPVKSQSLVNSIYEGVNKNRKILEAVKKMVKVIILNIFQERNKSTSKDPEDILIFLPSKSWIYTLQKELTDYLEYKKFKNFIAMDLSADVPIGLERDIRLNPKPGITKIILSTNIAETGVTVDGLKYVIDSGLAFKKGFDMVTRTSTMDLGFISQAEAKQRQGRAGRMQPGICYRLFTNDEFKSMVPFREPEILRTEFDGPLLGFFYQFKNQDDSFKIVKEVMDLLITPPPKEGFDATVKYFRQLGLLEDKHEKNRISYLGECFQSVQLPFELTNFFITAQAYEIEPEVVSDLVTILEIKSSYSQWFKVGREGLPKEFQSKYTNEFGDIIGLYQIYMDYKSGNIPEQYKQYLNLVLFDMIKERSDALSISGATSGYCPGLIKPRYSVKQNTYHNLVSAFRQSFEKTSTIKIKDLDLSRFKTNLLDLKKLPNSSEIIFLSSIVNLIFGQDPSRIYNNFIKPK
jgi:HrpA-like RNA helicase